MICSIVPVKLRGCCRPAALPTMLNADSDIEMFCFGYIPTNPSLEISNTLLPLLPVILTGRLKLTYPVAVVVPTIISLVLSEIIIRLS